MTNLTTWQRYAPVSIGVEDLFHRLDALADHTPNYPPFNLIRLDQERQRLECALAGFNKDDIIVSVERKVLNISVKKANETEGEYIHKGIAQRTFSRSWQLSDDTVVDDVTYINGLLRITLRREVPEEFKRKLFPIA